MTPRPRTLIAAMIAGLAATGCQTSKPGESNASYLFVQTAGTALLEGGKLTLENVAPLTVFFTDRPVREAGHFETDQFIEAMLEDTDRDSFADDPPNATLSLLEKEHVTTVVVELGEPAMEGPNIVYPVKILDGPETLRGGPVSLFIDPIGRPRSATSVAGRHRRDDRHVRHAVHRRR